MSTTKPENSSPPQSMSPLQQTLTFLSSMRFGIALLIVLSLLSAYATFFPLTFARERIYSSWWFLGALSLGALNLALCTVKSIGPRFQMAFNPPWVAKAAHLKLWPHFRELKTSPTPENLGKLKLALARQGFAVTERGAPTPEGVFLRADRGRLGYFGAVITHLGILLVLLGGMYGSLTGFDVSGSAYRGGSIDLAEQNLSIAIEDIRVHYNDPQGVLRPRVESQVRITSDGAEVMRGAVAINEPLRFDGITVYHSTFLWVSHITLSHPESGTVLHRLAIMDHEIVNIPGMPIAINSAGFFPDFTVRDGRPVSQSYKTNRPALVYRVIQEGRPLALRVLEPDMPLEITTPQGPMIITLTDYEKGVSYSVSRNLGRPYLFAGSMMILAGLFLSFFMAPTRVCAGVDAEGRLIIGARGFLRHHGVAQVLDNTNKLTDREEA